MLHRGRHIIHTAAGAGEGVGINRHSPVAVVAVLVGLGVEQESQSPEPVQLLPADAGRSDLSTFARLERHQSESEVGRVCHVSRVFQGYDTANPSFIHPDTSSACCRLEKRERQCTINR